MGTVPTKKIGDREFFFGYIPAVKAVRIEVKIAKLVGPLFAALRGEESEPTPAIPVEAAAKKKVKAKTKLDDGLEAAAQGEMLRRMLGDLEEDELIDIMTTVFNEVSCAGSRLTIDFFTGTPKDLWLVLWEGLRVNFADFFPENLSAILKSLVVQK